MAATDDDREHWRGLLLRSLELLAVRNGYAPSESFEYALWDDLERPTDLHLLSVEEADELTALPIPTDSWVAYDMDTGRFQVTDIN
jgi:hypothetical protein